MIFLLFMILFLICLGIGVKRKLIIEFKFFKERKIKEWYFILLSKFCFFFFDFLMISCIKGLYIIGDWVWGFVLYMFMYFIEV